MPITNYIKNDFEKMSKLSVEEYTLYRKWYEINSREWNNKELQRIWEVKHQIWKPEKPTDFKDLSPVLIHADSSFWNQTWNILRIFTSTMPWNMNVGRLKRFIVTNKYDTKFLGVISVASDFISLGGRDKKIGWTYQQRIKERMINYTAMGSSIVPTQPFGFNFVGGKLIALLTASDFIENIWNKRYKERLVGLTTTSLYGGYSQYSGLRYWKKCKSTEGRIPLEPSDECYKQIRTWVRETYPEDFDRLTKNVDKILSRPKARLLNFAYKQLKIKPPENDFSRGVYWCPLYMDSEAFLRKDTKDLGERRFDNSIGHLTEVWKEKYARKRVDNLTKSGVYNTKGLFYNEMIDLNWNEAKQKYLSGVGK